MFSKEIKTSRALPTRSCDCGLPKSSRGMCCPWEEAACPCASLLSLLLRTWVGCPRMRKALRKVRTAAMSLTDPASPSSKPQIRRTRDVTARTLSLESKAATSWKDDSLTASMLRPSPANSSTAFLLNAALHHHWILEAATSELIG